VELEAAAALYVPERHQSHVLLYGQDPGVTARCYLTFTCWMLGRPEPAWDSLAAAVGLAERLDHPFTTAWPMAFRVLMHSHRREPEEARAAAQRLIDFAMGQHQVYWLAAALIVRGWAMARLGQLDDGIAGMRNGIAAYAGSGAGVSLPHFIGLLAEVLLANGRIDEAEADLTRAETIAVANGERVARIDLCRLRGDLAAARGEGTPAAAAHYREAIAIALETRAVSPGLRAANSLHRALMVGGTGGSSPLPELVAMFPPGTSTPDLLEARGLLGHGRGQPSESPRTPLQIR
jgi:predicted ATPase